MLVSSLSRQKEDVPWWTIGDLGKVAVMAITKGRNLASVRTFRPLPELQGPAADSRRASAQRPAFAARRFCRRQ